MKTRVKKTALQKYQILGKNLSNSTLVHSLISKYQQDTKNAVQNILNMCLTLQEFYQKVKSNELNENDLNYFCATVCLDKKSSTFRKYLRIADKVDLFQEYLDKVPASYTILYEITTLDSDQFDLLIKSKQLNTFITLQDVKKIAGKNFSSATNISSTNTSEVMIKVTFDTAIVSDESLKLVADCYGYLKKLHDIEVTIPNEKVLSNALMCKMA
jgi:hypothetical protein